MKATLLLIIALFTFTIVSSQNELASLIPSTNETIENKAKDKNLYSEATTLAGKQIIDFVQQELTYPKTLKDYRIEGRILIDFLIDQNGNIVQTKIKKGINDEFDRLVLESLDQLKYIQTNHSLYYGAKSIRIPVDFKFH